MAAGGGDGAHPAREQAATKGPSKDPKKKKEEDLSDEDLALKQQLEVQVERVQDAGPGVQKLALESMRQEIRTATSSMTSVPKPLKFLRPHYVTLRTALAGLTIMLHACLDMKSIILGKYHYVLYFLVLAMQPRMLMTVEENLKPLTVPVRVSQAVDVVGQAGQLKTITGFQTRSTPVLLAAGDRAELVTEKYILLSPVLEGFVILRENPVYKDEK